MFNIGISIVPKPEDPVVIFSNGSFGLNPGNIKVSQNILKSLKEFEKIKTEDEIAPIKKDSKDNK